MNRENTKSLLGRPATAAVAVLAMLASALVLTGLSAAPAQAAEERPGYAKVQTPEPYLANRIARGQQILHVDTAHATPDGFWFAAKSGFHPGRDFGWVYQPYGLWCSGVTEVVFNPWMNTSGCATNFEAINDALGPYYEANTKACAARTGLPWKTGSSYVNQESYCGDRHLDRTVTSPNVEKGVEYTCAPWEDQGLTESGGPKCVQASYEWEDGPINQVWQPAPDTCTNMPADSNLKVPFYQPIDYAPVTGGDGSCTGEALAPNCPTGSLHQACTGIAPEDLVWATATVSVTVSDAAVSRSATSSATRRVVRYTVTKTASKRYRGKRYTASASRRIYKQATRSATRSAHVADGSSSSTVTSSCAAASLVDAQACAASRAAAEATQLARRAASDDAARRAGTAAGAAADRAAQEAALTAARAVPVTAAEKQSAASAAQRQARSQLARLIDRARRA